MPEDYTKYFSHKKREDSQNSNLLILITGYNDATTARPYCPFASPSQSLCKSVRLRLHRLHIFLCKHIA
jgi:hypothetical protein